MFIEGVDVKVTKQLNEQAQKEKRIQINKSARKEAEERLALKEKERSSTMSKQTFEEGDISTEEDDNTGPTKRRRFSDKAEERLKGFISTCERFNVSESAAAFLFNEANESGNNNQRITQSQINRKKTKSRIESVKTFETEQVTSIGFDERIDKTKTVKGVGAKGHKRFEMLKEEHCVVVLYPKAEYAGHVVPQDGRAVTLACELQQFSEDRGICWDNITTLISDGCEKMVGWKAGVHACLEKHHCRPFARLICFFHHLEKDFETVFCLYSGHTTGPSSYSGDVGNAIRGDVHKKLIVAFKVLPNPSLLLLLDAVSDETFRSLSNDHQTFLGLVRIVITGDVNYRWVWRRIGPMVTSRFTTTEARVLREWLSDPNPSFEMRRITHYLVYVWAECFLMSKHRNSFQQAPRVLLLEVMLTEKFCTVPEKTLLKTSMSTNGQMCHPENVLLSMLGSDTRKEREEAVNVIMGIRERGPVQWDTVTGVRPFKVRLDIILCIFLKLILCDTYPFSEGRPHG